ncbi:MAG: aminoacyl-tRNA hydrolase [Desulfotomaculum sp.]|nr:aminoacyl-tRNA hydrolase [Desulfotomaculum sp.]
MKMIVGLGNPGPEYSKTRHNVGFMVLDKLAGNLNTAVNKNKFKALMGEAEVNDEKVLLIKPQTYMNLSGEAVGRLAQWYKISPQDVVVIYDDMDLPLGKMRIRLKGSSGGHNGMKSIIAHLGTENFPRIRIGIGRGTESIKHVLSNFTKDEMKQVEEVLNNAVEAVITMLNKDINTAMNKYNG